MAKSVLSCVLPRSAPAARHLRLDLTWFAHGWGLAFETGLSRLWLGEWAGFGCLKTSCLQRRFKRSETTLTSLFRSMTHHYDSSRSDLPLPLSYPRHSFLLLFLLFFLRGWSSQDPRLLMVASLLRLHSAMKVMLTCAIPMTHNNCRCIRLALRTTEISKGRWRLTNLGVAALRRETLTCSSEVNCLRRGLVPACCLRGCWTCGNVRDYPTGFFV